MKEIHQIICKPLITEKSNIQKDESNQLAFEVDRRANKKEIKQAIEKLFKVKVVQVCTANVRGKTKRLGRNIGKRRDWKKATVKLREGDSIDFFEGV